MKFIDIKPFVRNAFVLNTDIHNDLVKAVDNRIFYVLKGDGEILIDNKKYAFKSGTVILINAGIKYCWLPSERDDFRFVILNYDYTMNNSHITKRFNPILADCFNEMDALEQIYFEDEEQLNEVIVIDNAHIVEKELLDIVEEFEKKQHLYNEYISGRLVTVITQLLRLCASGKREMQTKINIILTYISENYAKEITNKQLAGLVNYHPNYINTLLKKHNNCTLHAYLINFRLNKSLNRLLYTDLSVEEISNEIGFKSPSNFCTAFKKQFGMSPSSYRRNTNYI